MSVFNFMETFFFISLGITFILILLLVYHFKQRLGAIEQRSDTMFEIVNSMVKEMGIIKMMALAKQGSPFLPANSQTVPLDRVFNQYSSAGMPAFTQNNTMVQTSLEAIQEVVIDDEEIENLSDDDEEDDDDDEEDDDEDNDEDNDEDDGKDDGKDEDEDADEDNAEEKVVVSEDEAEALEIEAEKVSNGVSSMVETETLLEEVDLVLEADVVEMVGQDIAVVTETVATIEKSQTSDHEEYRKMSLGALKAVVLAKGLATDPSKMKKGQLLDLLLAV
jgi:cobalamin biosynthesis protein CobT